MQRIQQTGYMSYKAEVDFFKAHLKLLFKTTVKTIMKDDYPPYLHSSSLVRFCCPF